MKFLCLWTPLDLSCPHWTDSALSDGSKNQTQKEAATSAATRVSSQMPKGWNSIHTPPGVPSSRMGQETRGQEETFASFPHSRTHAPAVDGQTGPATLGLARSLLGASLFLPRSVPGRFLSLFLKHILPAVHPTASSSLAITRKNGPGPSFPSWLDLQVHGGLRRLFLIEKSHPCNSAGATHPAAKTQ